MATTADFKNGLFISYNGKPCQVVYFQHVKPGKGPAFVKTKLRNLENGRILENTFTAGMKIDVITVERRPYQFLYSDEDGFNFMHEETYEQIHLPHDVVENADLMKEGQHVEMSWSQRRGALPASFPLMSPLRSHIPSPPSKVTPLLPTLSRKSPLRPVPR